jgi:hypothetical protein
MHLKLLSVPYPDPASTLSPHPATPHSRTYDAVADGQVPDVGEATRTREAR